ncbi:MAG TPA: hypothetical protein PK481_09645, partial [Bacillota bacterium]|nr:hypothetical protein [Bacillota bacterium]
MLMDEKTKAILEFDRVLEELRPMTPFGQKLKNNIKAYEVSDKELLLEELDRVAVLKELINSQRAVFVEIRTQMRLIKDIRRSVERCIAGGVLNVVEFFELKNFAYIAKAISKCQKALHWAMPEKYRVKELQWVEAILDPENTGIKTFYIYDNYSEALAEIRSRKAASLHKLDVLKKEAIKRAEAELGIPVRASGEITVSKTQTNLIKKFNENNMLQPAGETYINVTFRVKPGEEMLELMKGIEEMKGEEAMEEALVLEKLSAQISVRGSEILEVMDAVAEFDLIIAKAYMANGYNGVKPVICDDEKLVIV